MAPFEDGRMRVFARFWGIALVAHIVGNFLQPDIPTFTGFANLATGLAALALALTPTPARFLLACALVPLSVVAEMPITGNHWVIAGFVSLSGLLTGGVPKPFFATVRWILIVFYSFAAFAKLNSGFLDPSVSCGVHFVSQWASGFGFGPVEPGSAISYLAVWGPTLTELAVPVLLLWRPTRPFGVMLATFFHTSISYDIHQHFYDFTSVLLPMFFAFAPEATARKMDEAFARFPDAPSRIVRNTFGVVAGLLVIASALPTNQPIRAALMYLPFLFWLPFSMWWMATLALALLPTPGDAIDLRLPAVGWAVVAIVFLNGLTPYTELKTAFGYNMYANLVTVNGESNHWLIRRTLPLRHGHDGPVRILDSSDEGLMRYIKEGWLIPYPEFRRYLSTRPDIRVAYERFGVRHDVARVHDDEELSAPVPWWWRFFPLRSLDETRPPRCQPVWLPAL